jgi:hypothetical protein
MPKQSSHWAAAGGKAAVGLLLILAVPLQVPRRNANAIRSIEKSLFNMSTPHRYEVNSIVGALFKFPSERLILLHMSLPVKKNVGLNTNGLKTLARRLTSG